MRNPNILRATGIILTSTVLALTSCAAPPAPRPEVIPPPIPAQSGVDYSTGSLLNVEATAIAESMRPSEIRQAQFSLTPQEKDYPWQTKIKIGEEDAVLYTDREMTAPFVFASLVPAQTTAIPFNPAFLPQEAAPAFSLAEFFRGFLLPVTLMEFSIQGGPQKMIEGQSAFPVFNDQGGIDGFLEFYAQHQATYTDAKTNLTFTIDTSLVYAQDTVGAAAQAGAKPAADEAAGTQNNSGTPPTQKQICYVDDEETNREYIHMFAPKDFDVKTFASCDALIAALTDAEKKLECDAFIVDHRLKDGKTGADCVRQIEGQKLNTRNARYFGYTTEPDIAASEFEAAKRGIETFDKFNRKGLFARIREVLAPENTIYTKDYLPPPGTDLRNLTDNQLEALMASFKEGGDITALQHLVFQDASALRLLRAMAQDGNISAQQDLAEISSKWVVPDSVK